MNQPANNLLCFDDQISCFTLSPYQWSPNLFAIGQPSKIILGILKLPVSEPAAVYPGIISSKGSFPFRKSRRMIASSGVS